MLKLKSPSTKIDDKYSNDLIDLQFIMYDANYEISRDTCYLAWSKYSTSKGVEWATLDKSTISYIVYIILKYTESDTTIEEEIKFRNTVELDKCKRRIDLFINTIRESELFPINMSKHKEAKIKDYLKRFFYD